MPERRQPHEPVRLLLIGAGKMGAAHAAAFHALPGVDLVGIASRGGDSAQRLAARYHIPHAGTDWQQIAGLSGANACVVAVSHELTEAVTAAALARGLHTLAEKPVSLEGARIRRLAESAERGGLVAMAAMNRRFYPPVTAALEIVRFHGPLAGVTVIAPDPVRPYRATRKYPPVVYDHWTKMNTLHAIDLLRLVGGEVESVCGRRQLSPVSGEQSLAATLQFRGGLLGSFISYGSHAGQWELRLHGEGVEARLMPLEQGTVRIGSAAPIALPSSAAPHGLKPGLQQQARAFVEAITDLGCVPAPGSDLFDHARTLDLAAQLVRLPNAAPVAPTPMTAEVLP